MKVYHVTLKEKKGESYWDAKPLIIVASSYGNAEDKALNFTGRDKDDILTISLFGETTRSTDVFEQLKR